MCALNVSNFFSSSSFFYVSSDLCYYYSTQALSYASPYLRGDHTSRCWLYHFKIRPYLLKLFIYHYTNFNDSRNWGELGASLSRLLGSILRQRHIEPYLDNKMLISGIIIILCSLLPRPSKLIWSNSTVSIFIGFIATSPLLYSPFTNDNIREITLLDSISSSMILLSLWVTALMLINRNKVIKQNKGPSFFCISTSFLLLVLSLCFSSSSIIIFYILFEVSLIPTLVLILVWGYQPERLQASLYLILYTTTASLPLLLAILYLMSANGPAYFTSIENLRTRKLYCTEMLQLFCILAFLVKIPIFISHLWLPKAHVEAPVAGRMILAGILLKLGRYGLIRIHFLIPSLVPSLGYFVISISAFGSIYTAIICTRQPDMKSLIAYASVSHIGLLLTSLFMFSHWRLTGTLLMIVAHGLASSALFALANSIYESTKTRRLALTKGILSVTPSLSILIFLGACANIGAPPSINLAAEIILLSNILNKSSVILPMIALASFYTAVYSLTLFTTTQHNSPNEYFNPIAPKELSQLSSSLLHLFPLVIFTLIPEPLVQWILWIK